MASTVDTTHKKHDFMSPQWQIARATVEGQRAVKALGEIVLPRLKDQTDADYNAYRMRASYVNFTWRTISALAGMIFRKDPEIIVPASIEPMLEDVTGSGVSFHIFAQQVTIEDLTTGRLGVLVDHPEQSTVGLTVADTQRMNIRPTMQLYAAETIYNWEPGRVNNQTVPVQVRLREDFTYPAEGFENPEVETRYRILDLVTRKSSDGAGENEGPVYRVRVFRINNKKEDEQVGPDIFPLMNGKPLPYIPFFPIGIDDTTLEMDEPPLIDLMEVNLHHFRLSADLMHGLHFTLPTPWIAGYTPENPGDKLYIGSAAAWVFPDPQTSVGFLEFKGEGLIPVSAEMIKNEERMAILGARLLASERKSTETAQAARIYRAGETSILSAMAATISIGLTKALNTFCEWARQPGDWSITLNNEFLPPEVTPQELAGWLAAWQQGAPGFSDEGFFNLLKKREMVTVDVTLEDEQERIASKPIPKPKTEE